MKCKVFGFAILLLLINQPFSKAQSVASSEFNFQLAKVDVSGQEVAYTFVDALKLVRFFMSQEGVKNCESDFRNNTMLLESNNGVLIQDILLNPGVMSQMQQMGFQLNFGNLPETNSIPAIQASTNAAASKKDKDCGDCKDVKVSQELLEGFTDDNYGGEQIMIDFNMGGGSSSSDFDSYDMGSGSSSDFGEFNMDEYNYELNSDSKINLDSLDKAINGPNIP